MQTTSSLQNVVPLDRRLANLLAIQLRDPDTTRDLHSPCRQTETISTAIAVRLRELA